jgi:hypothetical protein
MADFSSSTAKDAMDVVMSMNAVFSCFDDLMDRYNVYKVRTVLGTPTASKMWNCGSQDTSRLSETE